MGLKFSILGFFTWEKFGKDFFDLVSVVRIRESPCCRGSIFKRIYENFVGTLETVRNREVSVPRGSTVPMSMVKTSGAIS